MASKNAETEASNDFSLLVSGSVEHKPIEVPSPRVTVANKFETWIFEKRVWARYGSTIICFRMSFYDSRALAIMEALELQRMYYDHVAFLNMLECWPAYSSVFFSNVMK